LAAQAQARPGETFATVWSNGRGVERKLTFSEFASAVASGAGNFRKLGLVAPGRVALLAKGTLDFYVALISLEAAGLTPVLLNWRQPAATLAAMISDAGAVALAVAAPYYDLGDELASTVRVVVAIDGPAPNRWTWHVSEGGLGAAGGEEAAVFFTTGSTSRPKAVLHTSTTVLWTAETFPLEAVATTLCFMPNFHVLMSLQNFIVPMVRGVGCSIHGADATDAITAGLLLKAAADLRPTTIDTVPFILDEWSTLAVSELAPLAACSAVRSGGAPLPTAVATRLVEAGIRVRTHYGQTEAPGMRLLTVEGAAPDELAVMRPLGPVEISLDGGGDEGELLIRRCGAASPGYLAAGALVPGKTDASGWHRTGDVFRRTRARNGADGLRFASRVDDVILLSTGEMFNPVPMETSILDYARRHGIDVDRLVVLGSDHAAPFLVVESAEALKTKRAADELQRELWPGVEAANEAEVAYARVKRGHVLVATGERLPVSAKGNVIRPRAEKAFAEQLSQLAEQAASAGVDWAALEKAAAAAGYGDDVEAYATERGIKAEDLAVFGVDSLGIRSLTSRSVVEAERVADNIKAWTVTCVVVNHWYRPNFMRSGAYGVGALRVFYLAAVGGKYTAVSWGVQYLVTVSAFISSIFDNNGPTSSLLALVFAMGYADGTRDGKARLVKLTRREPTLFILILFMKFVVFFVACRAFHTESWTPASVYFDGPLNIVWFLYMLFIYRIGAWLLQRLPVPSRCVPLCRASALVAAVALQFLTNENFEALRVVVNTAGVLPRWLIAGANIFLLDGAFLSGKDTNVCDPDSMLAFWPSSKGSYTYSWFDIPYLTESGKNIEDFLVFSSQEKYWTFLAPWLLGYFHGERIIRAFRRAVPEAWNRNALCAAFVTAAFAINWILGTTYITWTARGAPAPFAPHMNRIYPADDAPDWPVDPPRWIWKNSPWGDRNGLNAWNPKWARPFYVLLDLGVNSLIAACIVAACAVVSWRAARCGNAALGKYMLMQSWPLGFFIWIIYLVSALGRTCGSDWLLVQLVQAIILCGYPYLFVYFIGPFFTAIVILIPKFVLFVTYDTLRSPTTAAADAIVFLRASPQYLRDWFANYFAEARRDLGLLRDALAHLAASIRDSTEACLGFCSARKLSRTEPDDASFSASSWPEGKYGSIDSSQCFNVV